MKVLVACEWSGVVRGAFRRHGQATNILPKPERGYWDNQTPSGQNKLGPSATRAQERGRTYEGIAEAMASQWGVR